MITIEERRKLLSIDEHTAKESYLGFKPCKYLCGNGSPCAKCAKDFWQSEDKPPKKEG